jgi:hypothetical protein
MIDRSTTVGVGLFVSCAFAWITSEFRRLMVLRSVLV